MSKRRMTGTGGTLKLAAACLLTLAWAAAATACGNGDDPENGTPDASPSAVAEATGTPLPNPTVTGDRVQSSTGYEATIPAGWRLTPNIVGGRLHGDAYFEGLGESDPNNPPASIAIVCEPVDAETPDLAAIMAEKVESLTTLRREGVTEGPHADIAGQPAGQIDYIFRLSNVQSTPVPGTPNIVQSRRDVVFISEKCVWTITLAAPEGTIATYDAVLDGFLASIVTT